MREKVEAYFHLGGGDPRGDRCIATLACLALLRRRLLKLTSSGWLTFPNEPPDQIQPCCPHSLLIRILLLALPTLSPIVILCRLLKGRPPTKLFKGV